jgi:hypothetical protein
MRQSQQPSPDVPAEVSQNSREGEQEALYAEAVGYFAANRGNARAMPLLVAHCLKRGLPADRVHAAARDGLAAA